MQPPPSFSFPFPHLPLEISFLIIDQASRPDFDREPVHPRLAYIDPLTLSLVCHSFRKIAMSNLLNRVILKSNDQLYLFINSIRFQRQWRAEGSRLALDYPFLVRHMHASDVWDLVVSQAADDFIDHKTLQEVMRSIDSVSLSFEASHILHDGFQYVPAPLTNEWRCRRISLTGSHFRWLPFTSSPGGMGFMSQITHLTLWIESGSSPSDEHEAPLPEWARRLPFFALPSLNHLAFPLWYWRNPGEANLYFYIVTPCIGVSGAFEKWARGEKSAVLIDKFNVPSNVFRDNTLNVWDSIYAQILTERIWTKSIGGRETKSYSIL
ncbi:hypothetical protein E1B28_010084 [Marasmius oreades]|uniref:F-box domain-containing protein n=1 Tax=Marasmius oreades TaxID=181124 RepID=A0A9P7UR47_9AGAR|nr:uncharacterized protein E1B28_010084 [Marasmius oreades]KAG7091023.1 hypothetical protein E1B28_010084 [Marasmius oreades]